MSPDKALDRAYGNGYRRGAHQEKDKVRGRKNFEEDTKAAQDRILELYATWSMPPEIPPNTVEARRAKDHILRDGAPAPALHEVKDFFRFYLLQSKGRLSKHASRDTVGLKARSFFSGFERHTRNPFDSEDRTEIYRWIKYDLTDEGDCINRHIPKHNFGPEVLDRLLLALWTRPDLLYIHERSRVQAAFLIHTYCWTGARIGAFFKGGLRYKHIDIILQRCPGGGTKLAWKIDQTWVKNNRDPENIVFSTTGKENMILRYSDSPLLQAMAFADGAVYGYKTLDEFWEQEIPPNKNEVRLRWKDSALEQPILRQVHQATGVSNQPWLESAFKVIFRALLDTCSYFCSASVHAIRRYLGKKVDDRYGEVVRSQHITQSDPRIFGASYVAQTSSADGESAFLDKPADHSVVEYYQGLEPYREEGLPSALPRARKDELQSDPLVVEQKERIAAACTAADASSEQKQLRNLLKSLEHKALAAYKESWVRERRDWIIKTRGKVATEIGTKLSRLCLLIPERARIAEKMTRTSALSVAEMREATRDHLALCTRDYTVFYLSGEEPVDGLCPVCNDKMEGYEKRYRARHIHSCTRIQRAVESSRKASSLEYCYECMKWRVQGFERDQHCQQHLSVLPKTCGSMTYCNTLIKPAYCPFHLAATDLPASKRLQSWDRDADALCHITDEHLRDADWPLPCPLGYHCESKDEQSFKDEESFKYHLSDCHGYSLPRVAQKRKRQREDGDFAQVKKQKTKESTSNSQLKFLAVKTERGANPTLPILLDGDDCIEPLAIFKAASTPTSINVSLSPEHTPTFFRLSSPCWTADEDLERYEDLVMSDWVNLPLSPPLQSSMRSFDGDATDSPWLDCDRITLSPTPALSSVPSSVHERHASPDTTVEIAKGSDSTDPAGSDPASGGTKKPKRPLVQLNYRRPENAQVIRPKIVLRCRRTGESDRQAGLRARRRDKRRRKA